MSVEDGGGQELPVPFRYDISPVDSKKTACYKPNAVAANFDHENHRAATLGAVYVGQCNRVPVQHSNKRLALVWEAAVIVGWAVFQSQAFAMVAMVSRP